MVPVCPDKERAAGVAPDTIVWLLEAVPPTAAGLLICDCPMV